MKKVFFALFAPFAVKDAFRSSKKTEISGIVRCELRMMKNDKLQTTVNKIASDVGTIGMEVIKLQETVNGLASKREVNERLDRLTDGQDKIIHILNRIDQERVFTYEAV